MKLTGRETEKSVVERDPRGGVAGFWALIGTQFQGAFSDNALKWLVSFFVLEAGVSREQRDFWLLARMLPELWPCAQQWTRLRQRASV